MELITTERAMSKNQTKKQLVADLYFNKNKTPLDISIELNITVQWVYSILISLDYNVDRVSSRTQKSIDLGKEICRLFKEENLTPKEISARTGKATITVFTHLRKAELIPPKYTKAPAEIDRELLHDLYIKQGLSSSKIADQFNVTQSCIWGLLRKYQLKNGVRNKVFIEEDDLRRMYLEDKLTSREIAKIFGVNLQTICSRLTKYGIRRTTPTIEDILPLIKNGVSQRQAAQQLGISQAKISIALKNIMREVII